MADTPPDETRRGELEGLSVPELEGLLARLRERLEKAEAGLNQQELLSSLTRHRSARVATGLVAGVRLDRRLESLFGALREGRTPWPAEELIQVIDGLISRVISRRIWIGILGVVTIIPAISSLVLLATQNREQIAMNDTRGEASYEATRDYAIQIVHVHWDQLDPISGESVRAPRFHKRLRQEALSTLVSLEKSRWTEAEKTAIPPDRFVMLKGADLQGLTFGDILGFQVNQALADYSRVSLEGCNLEESNFIYCNLEHSTFRGANARSMEMSGFQSTHMDFSQVDATGAYFGYSPLDQEPLNLAYSDLSQSIFDGAFFEIVYLEDVNLAQSSLQGAFFADCLLNRCDFTGADLQSADFSASVMMDCIITDANTEGTIWPEFTMTITDPESGDLIRTTDKEAWKAAHPEMLEEG